MFLSLSILVECALLETGEFSGVELVFRSTQKNIENSKHIKFIKSLKTHAECWPARHEVIIS